MKEQVKTDLTNFAKFLGERNLDFVVVGSIALETCGLPIGREPDDIDVEVLADYRSEEIFKAFADQYGNSFYKVKESNQELYGRGISHKPYIFKWGETKVNVWVYKESIPGSWVEKDGIKYATIGETLKKKLAYKRAKDFTDLLTIIRELSTLAGKYVPTPSSSQATQVSSQY